MPGRPPGSNRLRMYLKRRKTLERTRDSRGGLLGISLQHDRYQVSFPVYWGYQKEFFGNPTHAAVRYNHVVERVAGNHAVLCSMSAAMKLPVFRSETIPPKPLTRAPKRKPTRTTT